MPLPKTADEIEAARLRAIVEGDPPSRRAMTPRPSLEELRRLAEAATPGPWEWDTPYHYDLLSRGAGETVLGVWGYDFEMNWRNESADAAYIAAANPATILRLLDLLQKEGGSE